jgi:hypothetical protein
MNVIVIFLLILALVALGLLKLVRSQRVAVSNLDDLAGHTRAIDMAAFQNLVDPAETDFLRRNLSPVQFRIVQRERTLAAAEYVRRIAHNAAVLVQLGQMARLNPDPQLSESARVMVERAAHVRIVATLVLMKLYARSVVPGFPLAAEDMFRDYRNLTDSAVLFTRLQRPAFAGRVGAML